MLLMTLYSVLFALLGMGNAPAGVFLVLTVFLTGIGAAQSLLYGGRSPRAASVVAGMVLCPLITLGVFVYMSVVRRFKISTGEFEEIVGGLFCATFFYGPILGYLGGIFVASIFLFRTSDRSAMDADAEELAKPASDWKNVDSSKKDVTEEDPSN
jgi:hypothetical protein